MADPDEHGYDAIAARARAAGPVRCEVRCRRPLELPVQRILGELLAPAPWPAIERGRGRELGATYVDRAFENPEGDALLYYERCYGAVPGDGIGGSWTLLLRDGPVVWVQESLDAPGATLSFAISGEGAEAAAEQLREAIRSCGCATM